MTIFEAQLALALDPDDYQRWVWRREQSLAALAVVDGVSKPAIFYREQPVVNRARVEWQRLNPGAPFPPVLVRRPRHDAPPLNRKRPGTSR